MRCSNCPWLGAFIRRRNTTIKLILMLLHPRTRKMRRSRKNASERRLSRYYVFQRLIEKNRARSQASEGCHCNDGSGPLYAASRINGKWQGPYDYDEALKV